MSLIREIRVLLHFFLIVGSQMVACVEALADDFIVIPRGELTSTRFFQNQNDRQPLSEVNFSKKSATSLPPALASGELDRALSLETLFSGQEGSWFFETLVRDGLFKYLGPYQQRHPQAIYIRKAAVTLQEIHDYFKDPKILGKISHDSFTLSYPIIITEGAGLVIKNSNLVINDNSGANIINAGSLLVENSNIEAIFSKTTEFRPFILAWNGSYSEVVRSRIKGLGYNKKFSKGLTLASHKSISYPAGIVHIHDSVFTDMEQSVTIINGNLQITESEIKSGTGYLIRLKDSYAKLDGNVLNDSQTGGALQSTDSVVSFSNNVVSGHNQDALKFMGDQSELAVTDNIILNNAQDAITIKGAAQPSKTKVIEGNAITRNKGNGVVIENASSMVIARNTIGNNNGYALSAKSVAERMERGNGSPSERERKEKGSLKIYVNNFFGNDKAVFYVVGKQRILWGGNKIRQSKLMQAVFKGDISSVQSDILKHTLVHDQFVELVPVHRK